MLLTCPTCLRVCADIQHPGAGSTALLGSPGGPGEQARQRHARVLLLRGVSLRQGPGREVPPHIQVHTQRVRRGRLTLMVLLCKQPKGLMRTCFSY